MFTRVCQIIFYCFGYVVGCIAARFGFNLFVIKAIEERNKKREVEEAVRIMNDQGPNN